jgi:hypothetical protein
MTMFLSFSGSRDFEDDPGCAFMIDTPDGSRACGAARRPSSSYCSHHHSVCYIVSGSKDETVRLREVEALASAVGGRRGRRREAPSRHFLKKLEQAVRDFSCS